MKSFFLKVGEIIARSNKPVCDIRREYDVKLSEISRLKGEVEAHHLRMVVNLDKLYSSIKEEYQIILQDGKNRERLGELQKRIESCADTSGKDLVKMIELANKVAQVNKV